MNFLGIYREPEYSPGRHTSNDALILRLAAQALERSGVPVQLATLEEARSLWEKASLIFSMCQGPEALAELTRWKKEGAVIFNDPAASRQTYRDRLYRILPQKEIPFPTSVFLPTDGSLDVQRFQAYFHNGGAWLKRPDVHAMQPGDVMKVHRWEDLRSALQQFETRGLRQAVLQEHRAGDEVKFYAVQGGRFFWPYYPKDCQGYPFDAKILENMADQAAKAVQIGIYGGDAIISPDGTITLIDLNDWPSFAPCRGAAANAIAYYLKDAYHATQNNREATALTS